MATLKATRIIGTSILVLSVWEPLAGHGTMSATEGTGRIGTRRLPAALEALRGEARFEAVHAFQDAQYQEAFDHSMSVNNERS